MRARPNRLGLWVVLVCLFGGACSDEPEPSKQGAGAPRFNVLLLSLDTTRADRLGCYGHTAARTPNLDRLAAEGARFTAAYAPVPLTLPSHATLLSGMRPTAHGLHDNGRGSLPAGVPTLAEILKRAGLRTGAFVSTNVLDSAFGLARGFDEYADSMGARDERGMAPLQRRGDATASEVLAWLERERERPFFAWVHFYDPHSTYDPPSPWREQLKDPYDGEIAFMDAQIGRLLGALAKTGELARTIVIATADHGEGLGEHGELTHGALIQRSTMLVPLIVRVPGLAPRVVDTPVELADVAPTLLDVLGLAQPAPMDGRSLRAGLEGAALVERPVYAESEYCWLNFGWAPLYSIATAQWRYLGLQDDELYDLRSDGKETTNIAARETERADAMRHELERMLALAASAPSANATKVDPDLERAVSALGYASSGGVDRGPAPRSGLRHPKSMLAVLDDFSAGVGFIQHGRPADGIAPLKRAADACPDAATIHWQLGLAYSGAEQLADARKHFERALELEPTLEQAHYRLAILATKEDKLEEARKHFDASLALQPSAHLSLEGRAWVLVRSNEPDAAIADLRRLIELVPEEDAYWVSLVRVLRETGRRADSVQVLATAAAQRSPDHELVLFYAWELATNPDATVRDGKRAVELAERALQSPERRTSARLDTLAAAYAEAGRFDDAVRTLDEALGKLAQDADPHWKDEWQARREQYRRKEPMRDP